MAATRVEMVLLAATAAATRRETAARSAHDHMDMGCRRPRRLPQMSSSIRHRLPCSPPRYRIRLRHG